VILNRRAHSLDPTFLSTALLRPRPHLPPPGYYKSDSNTVLSSVPPPSFLIFPSPVFLVAPQNGALHEPCCDVFSLFPYRGRRIIETVSIMSTRIFSDSSAPPLDHSLLFSSGIRWPDLHSPPPLVLMTDHPLCLQTLSTHSSTLTASLRVRAL